MNKKILYTLIYLLIPIAGISGLLRLPIVINKIQPFEVVFIGAFILFIVHILRGPFAAPKLPFLLFFNPIDKALAFLVGLTCINLFIHPTFTVFLECVANAYVMAIYFFFSRLIFLQNDRQNYPKAWLWMVIISVLGGLIGNFWYYYSGSEQFVAVYKNSPYWGSIVRMKGFSASSNALASTLAFGFFMVVPFLEGYKKKIFVIVTLLAAVATQSKEAYFFLGILAFQIIFKYLHKKAYIRQLKNWAIGAYVLFFGLCLVSIFWVFCFGKANCNAAVAGLGPSFTLTETLKASPTGYFYLFEVAVHHIQQHPFWGIGLGNFSDSIAAFKQAGSYPMFLANYEAHDIYWGMVAQMGVGYLVFLGVFMRAIYQTWRQLGRSERLSNPLLWAFLSIFLFVGVDSLGNVGAFHFRHYWIFLGIFSGISSIQSDTPK